MWLQKMDAQRITDFILQHQPHLVVIGASMPEAAQLREDLQNIADSILTNHAALLTRFDTGVLFSSDPPPCFKELNCNSSFTNKHLLYYAVLCRAITLSKVWLRKAVPWPETQLRGSFIQRALFS